MQCAAVRNAALWYTDLQVHLMSVMKLERLILIL